MPTASSLRRLPGAALRFMSTPEIRPDRHVVTVLAVVAFAWLAFTIGMRPLSLPEEGRYVGVAWEMLRSGDWLVPTENGLPFLHKPPLFYWLTAASMATFGVGPGAARIVPLLGAMAGGAVFLRVVYQRAGSAVALWTGIALVSMPAFFASAQFANLDMLVAGCIAASVSLAADGVLRLREDRPATATIGWAWVAAALGLLAKGLIGIVLPGLVILVWLGISRQWRAIVRIVANPGVAAFALIVAPWFLMMETRYPGFARFFFIYQHVERYTGTGFNSVQPWWFYLVVVPLATLPWSPWLLVRLRGEPHDATGKAKRPWRLLLWVWLGVVVAFFSIPAAKPVGYVMPVLFPIAALAAGAIAQSLGRGARTRLAVGCAVAGLVLCLVTVGAAMRFDRRGNVAVATTLAQQRSAGDLVVFVGNYFFDVPVLARLEAPVIVAADWTDPAIAGNDNWKRELWEGARFAPALAATLLVDKRRALAPRCDGRPVWIVGGRDESPTDTAPSATRIATGSRSSLWRVPPQTCGSPTPPR